ncbi:MAG: STAS/SEC14 domain-containing protein [Flavobacteriales bacterium]|nr:STAS/SEC14 domain-containing protein [Flavobacteriales bacterium]MCB9167559.1 STAS/SEC14 domain-containing protein [Flavobacteriales bacterium]
MTEKETAEKIVFDEDHLRIHYDTDRSLVRLVWKGYVPSEDYRAALDTALEFVLRNKVHLWLADLRNMSAILRDDELWTNAEWFPRLARTKLQRMAILPSRDFFNQMSVKRIMDGTLGVIEFPVGYFAEEDESMEWLLGKDVKSA